MAMIKHDFGADGADVMKTAGRILLLICFGISVVLVGGLALILLIWII